MRLAGVNLTAGTSCNMNGKTILVASQGAELPVRVGAGQSVGGLLKVDVATPGQATAASSVTDGQVIGVVSDNNSGSTSQVFISTLVAQ